MYVLFSVTLYACAYRAAHIAEKERSWPISFIGRFLAHLAQLFLYRERPEAGGEQKMVRCLKKCIKINVSIFSV
jgi:hypothetical protein